MKKYLLVPAVAICLISISACQKKVTCAGVQHVNEQVYLMEKFLGNYEQGTVWIYLNRDSTKYDSIYLSNFQTHNAGENKNCLTGDLTEFEMNSNYLAGGQVVYARLGFDVNGDQITHLFEWKDGQNNMLMQIFAKNDDFNSFYNGSNTYSIQNSFQLWPHNQVLVFPEYVRISDKVFAPDFGLVQYVAAGDTFSLIKTFYQP